MSKQEIGPSRGPRDVVKQGYQSLHAFQDRMDYLFDDFLDRLYLPFAASSQDGAAAISPRVDVVETPEDYRLSIEIPGVEQKDIDIELAENTLTVSGEKRSESKREGKDNVVREERSYGKFRRTFSLPFEVDAERVSATFKNGVLQIELPKSEKVQASTHKIEITS